MSVCVESKLCHMEGKEEVRDLMDWRARGSAPRLFSQDFMGYHIAATVVSWWQFHFSPLNCNGLDFIWFLHFVPSHHIGGIDGTIGY